MSDSDGSDLDGAERKPGSSVGSYDFVATFYEQMSTLFSLGQIQASKRHQYDFWQAGEHVLFLGCGCGREVAAAAELGCHVTAVDRSQKMLDKLARRLEKRQPNEQRVSTSLICSEIESLPDQPQYDTVVANYFLNCFTEEAMVPLMQKAWRLLKTGGKFMIADVAPPTGGWLARCVNQVYLHSAMLPFWMLGLVQWHRNHDYVPLLENLGSEVKSVARFRLAFVGPVVFRSIVGVKPETS